MPQRYGGRPFLGSRPDLGVPVRGVYGRGVLVMLCINSTSGIPGAENMTDTVIM
jgi:hypothetical protein